MDVARAQGKVCIIQPETFDSFMLHKPQEHVWLILFMFPLFISAWQFLSDLFFWMSCSLAFIEHAAAGDDMKKQVQLRKFYRAVEKGCLSIYNTYWVSGTMYVRGSSQPKSVHFNVKACTLRIERSYWLLARSTSTTMALKVYDKLVQRETYSYRCVQEETTCITH